MSIAEFYIENGIDPTEPDHMSRFLDRIRDDSSYGVDSDDDDDVGAGGTEFAFVGLAVSAHDAWPLNERQLDAMADLEGWNKLSTHSSRAPMASYQRGDVRLNFWLSTGTVGSYLEHPRQGKTQLFRRKVSMQEATQIFANPRMHSGRGYQQRACRYGANCRRNNCRFQHPPRGRGPCRYGADCYRPDCWFDHPAGRDV